MKPRDIHNGLTAARLRAVLSYNPETGLFTWIELPHKSASNIRVGGAAGIRENTGYIRIFLDGHRYQAHRLAWLYMTGGWPEDGIDHKNCVQSDNRWENLRKANNRQNAANRRVHNNNALGIKGIRLHECGKYQARIYVNGQFVAKLFNTLEEAISAHGILSKGAFGRFARPA
jgi:HNH endonuclease